MIKKYVVGNWKMNGSKLFIQNYIDEIKKNSLVFDKNIKKLICVPYPYLYLTKNFNDYGIEVGAQNVYTNQSNSKAFTGEVSVDMLLDFNIKYVIVGHSERRALFNENNILLNKKIFSCLNNNITPIVCLGTLNSGNKNFDLQRLLKTDLIDLFKNIDVQLLNNVIIAYEPIDSIGTGKTPEISKIYYVIKMIRNVILDLYNINIPILYGGSVNTNNCKSILNDANTDGLLIGGASLKAKDFLNILSLC